MSEFYGEVQGHRGRATRCGSKASGIETEASTWRNIITVRQYSSEHTASEHQASISLSDKHGASVLYTAFDADTVVTHSSDPKVQEAMSKVRDAFDTLDIAAAAAAAKVSA